VTCQVTVLVRHDNGSYSQRLDEILPKGAIGPSVEYSWNEAQWTPARCNADGGGVPMPRPNFIERAKGVCRTIFDDSHLGRLSIWSVALPDEHGNWMSDFWYWFNQHQQQVIFSLAPAPFLTVIYYQTFVRNGSIAACAFDNPCADIPPSPDHMLAALRVTAAATCAGFGSVAFTPAQFYLFHMLQRTFPAGFIAPCLPTKTDKLPSGSQWLHEIKHDGFRIIARKNGTQVRLYSRPGTCSRMVRAMTSPQGSLACVCIVAF
jgi:hypothetical protein